MTRPFFTRERISDFDIYERNCDLALGTAKVRTREGFPIEFQVTLSWRLWKSSFDGSSVFCFIGPCLEIHVGLCNRVSLWSQCQFTLCRDTLSTFLSSQKSRGVHESFLKRVYPSVQGGPTPLFHTVSFWQGLGTKRILERRRKPVEENYGQFHWAVDVRRFGEKG